MKSITITWDISDVHDCVDGLTDDQAYQVLLSVKKHHDAEIGINWDVIQTTAEILFPYTVSI